jgi:hypothetical protein
MTRKIMTNSSVVDFIKIYTRIPNSRESELDESIEKSFWKNLLPGC